jgi:hypothetical protein
LAFGDPEHLKRVGEDREQSYEVEEFLDHFAYSHEIIRWEKVQYFGIFFMSHSCEPHFLNRNFGKITSTGNY